MDIGVMGSSVRGSGRGLAMLRLDRAAEALAAGKPLMSGGMPLNVVKPDWAHWQHSWMLTLTVRVMPRRSARWPRRWPRPR